MNFKHKRRAAWVLAAVWYAAGASAADYNTQIYSVKVDAENGVLRIEGIDLAPAGAPVNAYVQLLGQTLSVHAAGSSSTHLEAALPEGLSLEPETGYQLYVSPDRSRSSAGTSPADQAFFTLYVSSRVEGIKATTVVGGGHGATATGAAAPAGSARNASSNFFNSLGSAFSLNSHSTNSNITNGPTPNNGSTFSLPYTGSLGSTSTLFSLTNTGTGDAIDGISSSTAANSTAVLGMLSSTTPGANAAAVRGVNNGTSGNGIGVWGSHAGSGIGVNGTSVTGYGVRAAATGAGIGLLAYSGAGPGLYATSNTGQAGSFTITNTSSTSDVHRIVNQGLGRGLFINSLNANSTGAGLQVNVATAGSGESITNTNSSNTANTLYVTTNGAGVIADHSQGNAGNFFNNNVSGVGAGVRGEVNSTYGNEGTAGVFGVGSGGGGYGGYFEQTSATGYGTALFATTQGLGPAVQFQTSLSTNTYNTLTVTQNGTADALYAVTYGTGPAAVFAVSPTGNNATAVTIQHNGGGVALNVQDLNANSAADVLDATALGGGNAGNFSVNNSGSAGMGVIGQTNSTYGLGHGVPPSSGVYGLTTGTDSYGGYFEHNNSSGFGGALYATNAGGGSAGEFYTTNTSSSTPTIYANNQGTAPTIQLNKAAAGGDIAWFQTGAANVVRFDSTGKGFFNGGTQTGGADLAEFVPTFGATPQVGDVVEIDPKHRNSFRLCAHANTTRVAGIISTDPGVTLNARGGARQTVSGPALALAGRVPTKVNNRSGAIHIGDLLVASAEPGRAMRAPRHPQPGTVIGKALEDSAAAQDTIEVLVMLR